MKKVKIMLTALTVFAVVGGALAFKAFDNKAIFCTDHSVSQGACTITPLLVSTFTEETSAPIFSYCTDQANATCTVQKYVTRAENND